MSDGAEKKWVRVRLMRLEGLVKRHGWRWEWVVSGSVKYWAVISPKGARWRLRLSGGAFVQRVVEKL